jgi:methionine synthase II (cobalamin-independent)
MTRKDPSSVAEINQGGIPVDQDLRPQHVHLVGSVGLPGPEEVFRTAGRLLGERLKRIPDGEPGGRRLWISWQYPLLRSYPFLRPDPSGAVRPTNKFPLLCLAEGATAKDVSFGELGYAREARASYQDFLAARKRGDIPKTARFQICLPTPLAVTHSFCSKDLDVIEPAYEAAMLREVKALCRALPHRDLCLQWDVCNEMVQWDGQPTNGVPVHTKTNEELVERLVRLCATVPADVELGIHLCYGDFGARHFVEPRDASKMVEFANAIAAAAKHRLAYIHMPIPAQHKDDAFYRPLAGLKLKRGTELFLGLVHGADGVEGTQERIRTARRFVKNFGIATECGMARARTPQIVEGLLRIHAACSENATRKPKGSRKKV